MKKQQKSKYAKLFSKRRNKSSSYNRNSTSGVRSIDKEEIIKWKITRELILEQLSFIKRKLILI